MEHKSILMRRKVHFNQNAFTDLELSNFTTFDKKLCVIKFCKSKNYESPSRIQTRLSDSYLTY